MSQEAHWRPLVASVQYTIRIQTLQHILTLQLTSITSQIKWIHDKNTDTKLPQS